MSEGQGGPDVDLARVADELRELVDGARSDLERLGPDRARQPLREGGWSAQQMLGHLIDSAVVNQQRLVRARLEDELVVTPYDQNGWVAAQQMDRRLWVDVVELWVAVNLHVAHLIDSTPQEAASRPCRLASGEAVTLGFLAQDYVVHQRHHLKSILGAA